MSTLEPDPTKFQLSPEDTKAFVIERETVAFFLVNTAIYLWFRGLDLVSGHLLAASAVDVLRGVGKTKGVTSHVFNKEMEKLLGKKLRLAMNFFKHAHNDPTSVLKFLPGATEFLLIDAVQMYGKIYGSLTPLMHTFRAWWMITRGRNVKPAEELQIFMPEGTLIEDLVSFGRSEFMDEVLPLFAAEYPLTTKPPEKA